VEERRAVGRRNRETIGAVIPRPSIGAGCYAEAGEGRVNAEVAPPGPKFAGPVNDENLDCDLNHNSVDHDGLFAVIAKLPELLHGRTEPRARKCGTSPKLSLTIKKGADRIRTRGDADKGLDMMNFFKRVLAFLIVLLAIVVFWPLWPSQQYRGLALVISVRVLLSLAAIYGTLAVADFVYRRKKGML
jgi:hypothetical protein